MNTSHYHSLREQIEGLLTEGQQFGRRAAEWEKVETYWHIGDALTRYLEAHGGPTKGQETIRNLSQDAHLGLTTLYEILRFRQRVNVLCRVARGISPPRSHRSGRESLDSSGSYRPAAGRSRLQCTKSRGSR